MRTVSLAAEERLTASAIRFSGALPDTVVNAAAAIVEDVRSRGDAAVREYALRFDGACPEVLRVSSEVVNSALTMVDARFLAALSKAHEQIRAFHERELLGSWFTTRDDGTLLGVQVNPIESVAVYVPGGRANYPSTVLMAVTPAKVAGVHRIVMLTPPQADGSLNPYTLAAASLAGVDEVYAIGGAQAIAAAAYGTESLTAVDKIVGPGNAYVAAAKRHVSGDVGIDMVAGPSEVCVLADESADPVVVACDLMAQAEHDPLASCYLVTTSAPLAEQVEAALSELTIQSPRAEITQTSLDDNGLIVVAASLDDAVTAVNDIAPEHLELYCNDGFGLLGRIKNAGAIFVGPWSSEPLGDYIAGPNHTLPTGGTARFSSPLGTYDFQKRSSVIAYTPEGLQADGSAMQLLAQAEGLWAHALSVGMRRRILERGSSTCEEVFSIAWPEHLDEAGRL